MKIDKIKLKMQQSVLEYCMLHILKKKDIYISDLIEELQDADLLRVEGVVYPLLYRFKNAGWISFDWANSESSLPKKQYSLTEKGTEELQKLDDYWNGVEEAIQKFKQIDENESSDKAE